MEGNTQKMREVLKAAKQYLDGYTVNILELRRKVDAALAKPVLNCEVGTADEQAQRFHKFCMEHQGYIVGMCNHNCPCIDSGDQCHCLCNWGQMPYPEGVEK